MSARSVVLALFVAAVAAVPTSAQLTTELALDVRSVSVADATDDGLWIAASVSTRRGRTDTDHYRFGDPTYLAPRFGELLIVDVAAGEVRSLHDVPVQFRNPAWSPDGTRLAYYLRNGGGYDLHVFDRSSGRDVEVGLGTDNPLSSSAPLVWSPAGDRILVALRPAGWAEEARRGFLEVTEGPVVVQDSRNDFLAWDRVRSLDDREILALVTVADGTVEEVLPDTPVRSVRFTEDGSALLYSVARRLKTPYGRRDGIEYSTHRLPLGGEPETVLAKTGSPFGGTMRARPWRTATRATSS